LKILTSRFGEIEVEDSAVVDMPAGVIGFPGRQRYVIIRHNPESPFYWFQSVDESDLAFVIVDPKVFMPDFEVPMPKSLLEAIGAESPDQVSIFVIITIPEGHPEAMTANMLGPVVVNPEARLARQIVLDDRRYSHRHPILQESNPDKQSDSPSE
jgi:flagellar assembly factor FliW